MRFDFDDNWFVIEVSMKVETFFFKFKSPSHYYRCLSQGNWHFLKMSNRSFFQSFSHGLYRSVVDREKVSLIFLLRVKNKKKMYSLTRELTIRMKKLINAPVKVYDISELSATDMKLLNSKNGIHSFNQILGKI